MFNKILFYVQYAARNLWRNRRWSAFAMLSVAAGVATVVALRSLGLAVGDSLNGNVRSTNHGDITLFKGSGGPFSINIGEAESEDVFSSAHLNALQTWADENDATMTDYVFLSLQVTKAEQTSAGLLNFMSAVLIDPEAYPLTQDIEALEPKNVPLSELFQGGHEVVISENLAQSQGLEVGDEVRVSGTEQRFVVRGIVPTTAEANLRDLFAAFFGFVYFDRSQAETLGIDAQPNRVSILLPDGTSNDDIAAAGDELEGLSRRYGGLSNVMTVPRLIRQNDVIADVTTRFVVVMGLGAMLIGGVGIINTMLVMVRRRTEEIAALKTFGLKGRQVAALFMTEGLLLGLCGSIVGSIIGALLSGITNAYGEQFIQQPLTWRIYPEALLFGVILGTVVSAVFGVMPVLTAVQVRPAIILRPNETHIPRLGVIQSLFATLFVVFALGLIAGQVLGPLPEIVDAPFGLPFPAHLTIGVIGVAATLLFLAILVLLLWVVVWIVGKIPTFGWIDLRMALVNLRSRRMRTATTLLAISVGMFALSSITFYGAGVREILQFSLTDTFGGNVLIFSAASMANIPVLAQNAERQLSEKLDTLEGVQYRTISMTYNATVAEIDGESYRSDGGVSNRRLFEERQEAAEAQNWDRVAEIDAQIGSGFSPFIDIGVRDTDNPDVSSGKLIAGRHLTLEDSGQNVAVVSYTPDFQKTGIQVGSHLIVGIESREIDFEVVGLVEYSEGPSESQGAVRLPADTLPSNMRPDFQMTTVMVEPEHMTDVLLGISEMPGFFPLNVAFIDGVLSRLIDQFSALPILVGLLSLGAAAVIMANTVALATLERRKQIGILKAVGLKSRRVLSIMLLENTLVSLLGGLIGIGLSALGVGAMTRLGLGDMVLIPDDAKPVAIALVVAAVLIGMVSTFLSANVAVRERVLNVLRYE